MKKLIAITLSILLLFNVVGCSGQNFDNLKPEDLKNKIAEIIENYNLTPVEKEMAILPYLVNDAVKYDPDSHSLVVTEDYRDALRDGIDYVESAVYGYYGEIENQANGREELSEKLLESMTSSNLQENQLGVYSYIYLLTIDLLSSKNNTHNPDNYINSWTESEISAVKSTANKYKSYFAKLSSNKSLSAQVHGALENYDPVAMMVYYVNTKKTFNDNLLSNLAYNPIKVLAYSKFFNQQQIASFYNAFPSDGNTALSLFFLKSKLADKTANLRIYAKTNSIASSILSMNIDSSFSPILQDFVTNYEKTAKPLKDVAFDAFADINYSTISTSELLSAPIDALPATYVIAVNPKGNKTFNTQPEIYTQIQNYISSNSSLTAAPLEYARYLIVASYKYKKTRYYYKYKGKKRIYKLSGTLYVYDRVSGARLNKISFASKGAPKRIYVSEIPYYVRPNMDRVKDAFFVSFRSALYYLQ